MLNQAVEMPVKSVPVRQIIATTSEWIHALGSDMSLYLVPAVPRTHSYQDAYCDSAVLSALSITTPDATVLSFPGHLAFKAGLAPGEGSDVAPQQLIGWRLPPQCEGRRLLQILPSNWVPNITNRAQFLEVLILDLWFRRSGQRKAVFQQRGQEIEAIFLPFGSFQGAQTTTVEQVRFNQAAVYNGLQWARIEASLKAKIALLSLSDLGRQLGKLPYIGARHEVLKYIWFETVVNKVCFDQSLSDAMGSLFGGVVNKNHESAFEIPAARLRAKPSPNR